MRLIFHQSLEGFRKNILLKFIAKIFEIKGLYSIIFLNLKLEDSLDESVRIFPGELEFLTQVRNDIFDDIYVKGCTII